MSGNRNTTRQNNLREVLNALSQRRAEVEALLGPDIPFDRFHAAITQALRSNPGVLDATPKSLIEACIKAAYDRLRIDGREAAIITRDITVNRNLPNEHKITIAQYHPMAFGMVQQILRGGEIVSMYADVIRAADEYHVQRGTNPGIHHVPLLTGERGEIIAAYSVATHKSGAVTFELLDRADLAAIKAMAQTKDVWERWPGEQSKKSAIRRHRKTLPLGDRDIVIRDAEAEDLYGTLQPGEREALPAPTPPRPTRQSLAHQPGASGVPLDFGDDEDAVVIDQPDQPKRERRKKVADADKKKPAAETGKPPRNMQRDMRGDEMPEDDAAWATWAADVEKKIAAAADADAVNAIATAEEPRIAAASRERAEWIRGAIADRLTDFATDEGAADGEQ